MVELLGLFEPNEDRAALLLRVTLALDFDHAVPHFFPHFAIFGMDLGDAIEASYTAGW